MKICVNKNLALQNIYSQQLIVLFDQYNKKWCQEIPV